jgi:hypothetical protein
MLHFNVTWARYDPGTARLAFCASGVRDDCRFTVITDVKCLKVPPTQEKVHIVALLRLTELFRYPSASGR